MAITNNSIYGMKLFKLFSVLIITLTLISCSSDEKGNEGYIDVYNLPIIPYNYSNPNFPPTFTPYVFGFDNTPSDNALTDDIVTLGRVLFYDKKMSINNTISCASCHKQELGFSDDVPKSIGFEGTHTFRNTMGFANAGFYSAENFFWDHGAATLEDQVLIPIQDEVEMGMTLNELVEKIRALEYYYPLFENAFGDTQVTNDRISKALSQFIRSIYSYNTKYDEGIEITNDIFVYFPNFTAEENLGKDIFNGKLTPEAIGTCITCHLPNNVPLHFDQPLPDNANQVIFSGAEEDNVGLDIDLNVEDNGVGAILGVISLYGHFKTPSLRNIELTGPYMHDGRLATLEEVVEHYSTGVLAHPYLSAHMKNSEGEPRHLDLTPEESAALVAFLKTLTDYDLISDEKFSDPFIN
jgi:cytochrome c peroxidase